MRRQDNMEMVEQVTNCTYRETQRQRETITTIGIDRKLCGTIEK